MANTQMIDAKADEVIHLFTVIQKYGATCGLEFNTENSPDPLIATSNASVKVDYFEGSDGDSVVIELGEYEFSFDLKNHGFSKDVSDCQIIVLVTENDGRYAAWFNSGVISPEGIAEANSYNETDEEFTDMEIRLDATDVDSFDIEFKSLCDLLQEGRVIKKTEVVGDGNQVLTVGFYDKDTDHAGA